MAPREVDGCAKLWKRAGAEVRNFSVWPLGPQPAERGVFGHNEGVACGSRETVTNPSQPMALDQTGYGAVQRVHLGPLNRTFPALYFPGSSLSVENHCFGTLGQSASFRHMYPTTKKCQT